MDNVQICFYIWTLSKITVFMFRKIIVALCITFAAGLMFANVYISMVDARSWVSNIPQSVYTEREYFKTVNPGDFFRLLAPVMQALLLVLLVVCWRLGAQVRMLCAVAFVMGIGIDVFTFGYFYPRNEIMLHGTDMEQIKKAVHEWIFMDRFRSALACVNVILIFVIQAKIYRRDIVNK